ncbi:MAG: hypothetical protein P3W93_001355 [Thermus sp.]|nr:hypothetical protein [Thermus sp.]
MENREEDCRKLLQWYEKRWEEDFKRWQAEKAALEGRLQECLDAIYQERAKYAMDLARLRADYEAQLARKEEEAKGLRREKAACQEDLLGAKRALERATHPPLGEGFFHRLAQDSALWDQVLLEKAQLLTGRNLPSFLRDAWRRRASFLAAVVKGQSVNWKELWTGMVLEWALWAWLEGNGAEPAKEENG